MPLRHQVQPLEGASPRLRRLILQPEVLHIYEIYVDDDRYAVPTLHLVEAADARAATEVAQRLLDESPHHLGVELCLNGDRLVGLGVFATRRSMPDRRPA